MNKKGFAATGILYTILVLFVLLIFSLLTMLYSRNNLLHKIRNEIKGNLSYNVYDMYDNGTAVYFNPETGNLCDESDAVSTTGTKTGCMKWYIYNDNITNSYVNMILDHNTTALVAFNSESNNSEMKEIKTELDNLVTVTNWKVSPRLISADEVAEISGAKGALAWNSTKPYSATPDLTNTISYFYLDGASGNDSTWHTQVVNSLGASNYAWLFDYTNSCAQYGCNVEDDSTYGYWTSTGFSNYTNLGWNLTRYGHLGYNDVNLAENFGLRPVITLDKKVLKQQKYVMTNIFENGSFENGFTGWNSNLYGKGGGTSSIAYSSTGVNSVYINAIDANEKAIQYVNSEITLKANHLYYFAMEGYVTSYTSGLSTFGSLVNSVKHIGFEPAILNKWQRLSDVITTTNDSTNVDIRFGQVFAFDCVYQAYMDDIMLIDLTETFGSGNEPTKEWCDQNIDWFEGSKNIYK